ncbi:hypothetical protein M378DRAFT_160157 [Amanita muscaria Koide BX008]|uniref:Uncharacterized protein n=1 Tax=Amanita muscaria (strain Koide BX008) TaxID=946122 RepID=A0A0C2WZA3_AMAMK|nr:hypothetical protein M378DRAFT_160157 [Amanita muscaria Koide BX008]
MSITLEFTGVAVWVFFILANASEHGSSVVTNTQCNFTLDGQHAGSFTDMSTSKIQYNVTSFSRSGLANVTHQLIISTNDYPFNAFVSFDYAIYTADVDDPSSIKTTSFGSSVPPKLPQWVLLAARSSSSSSGNVGVVVGSVLGGLALVIILVSLVLIRRISQRKGTKYRSVQNATERPSQDPRRGYVTATHISSEQLGAAGSMPRFGALHIETGSHSQSRSLSSTDNLDLPSSGGSLTPMRRHQEPSAHLPGTSNQEKLRIMRQREINDRLQLAQREMSSLASRQISPSEGSSSAGQEMASLREQVQELRDQIGDLQTQRSSDWAMGLTDEQPPAYT